MAGRKAPTEGFEWTCPYCEQSRLNTSTGDEGKENAIAALRTHIVASDGEEHGPRNDFPADFDTLSLDEYVARVDGER